jgi:hypothetical protein
VCVLFQLPLVVQILHRYDVAIIAIHIIITIAVTPRVSFNLSHT